MSITVICPNWPRLAPRGQRSEQRCACHRVKQSVHRHHAVERFRYRKTSSLQTAHGELVGPFAVKAVKQPVGGFAELTWVEAPCLLDQHLLGFATTIDRNLGQGVADHLRMTPGDGAISDCGRSGGFAFGDRMRDRCPPGRLRGR
jgi:hypothetical protein